MKYRKQIINSLIPYFKKDKRYHLLISDMGFGAVDQMKEQMPERMTNCGIMEQGMVGIAAGMAIAGMIPVIYSIVNFLCFRALEQIRNDIVLQRLNVKLIGTGANNHFDFLGNSHCCGLDDVKIMNIIHMPVYDPFDLEFKEIFDEWITSDRAGYIRV